MVKSPTTKTKKVSKLEGIKERSNFLRQPLATELREDTTHFSEDGVQILKFHGSYQQDNRDNRVKGQEKDYQFMLRTRNPGGFIPPQLYLTLERLSEEYGNHTLRVTTRQGFQLHGILKKNLKTVMAAMIENMGSTLGACGDLNRNVMAPPAPYKNRLEYQYAWEYAEQIADLLKPQTGAYYEIWLDGEKAISAEEAPEVKAARQKDGTGTTFPDGEEPIYGTHYMPRKFKCCVTVPGDNSLDVYTHDVSLVVMANEGGELEGFNVLVGGGLGRTHRQGETFARTSDPLGYIDKEDVYDLMKAIVATQRDYGDRVNRRHARMKYLLHDWGGDRFRAKVEGYLGKSLEPFKPLPEWKYQDYLGWHEQGDGKLFFGLSIENGRVKNDGSFQLKTALKTIIEQYELPMRLTANHNIILYEIDPHWRNSIEEIFKNHGVETNPESINPLTRHAMACPALPTCGLAIAESERALPGIVERIQALLNKLGMGAEKFVIRMTGCPNGCARPYMAELGFVGSGPDAYQIWLGGSPDQTRLAVAYEEKLPVTDLEQFLEPMFVFFRDKKQTGESFGDFCHRVGFKAIRSFAASYQSKAKKSTSKGTKRSRVRKNEHRISVYENLYQKLKATSQQQKKPMNQILAEALEAYFAREES
jgi:sulfite reductase (ferredoxin)